MSRTVIQIILMFAICHSAMALETDNYISWDQNLEDSSDELNSYFLSQILIVLKRTHAENKSLSCEQVTGEIAKVFRSRMVHDNPVENYLIENLSPAEIYPQTLSYVEKSIFRDPFLPHIPKFGLAPNIQVNDNTFGTDKLSHFASTGHHYYVIYQKALKLNPDTEDAEKMAIQYGVADEKMVHGYWASGVFSYADLEANYQGMLFYKKLCGGSSSYLAKDQAGQWQLLRSPDIREYTSPFWDETFNRSYFVERNWKKVSAVIKSDYCEKRNLPQVQNKFLGYQQRSQETAYSKYISTLIKNGKAPAPQSVDELCRN